MNTPDQTTAATFNPTDFGIKNGQMWREPVIIGADGAGYRDLWTVQEVAQGRVRIKCGYRTKLVCPFVLAFNYEKVLDS